MRDGDKDGERKTDRQRQGERERERERQRKRQRKRQKQRGGEEDRQTDKDRETQKDREATDGGRGLACSLFTSISLVVFLADASQSLPVAADGVLAVTFYVTHVCKRQRKHANRPKPPVIFTVCPSVVIWDLFLLCKFWSLFPIKASFDSCN